MPKYNLKPLILSTLNEQGKGRFSNFAADIEAQLEPMIEETVREQVGRALKRVTRQALDEDNNNKQKGTNHENTTEG